VGAQASGSVHSLANYIAMVHSMFERRDVMTGSLLKTIGASLAAITIGASLLSTPVIAAPRHAGGGHFAHGGGGSYCGGGYYGGDGYYGDCYYQGYYGPACGPDVGPGIVGGIIGGALGAMERGYY
jgi:hypothetical protein